MLHYCCELQMMWKKIQGLLFMRLLIQPKQICADFSQSNGRQFGRNAGKQCVAMSLTAIVHTQVKHITTWDTSFLNTILSVGNNLYICIANSIKLNYLQTQLIFCC